MLQCRIIRKAEKNQKEFLQILGGLTVQEQAELLVFSDSGEICRYCMAHRIAVAAVLPSQDDLFFVPYAVSEPEQLEERECLRIWQRANDLPWEIARTKRCLIRESILSDLDDFYRIYGEPGNGQFCIGERLGADHALEADKLAAYRKQMYGFYGYGLWTVCLAENGRVIGRAGIGLPQESEQQSAVIPELGYAIDRAFRRQGYAEEVCRAILRAAFEELGLPQVAVRMDAENEPSVRLCTKLGFLPQACDRAGETAGNGEKLLYFVKSCDPMHHFV